MFIKDDYDFRDLQNACWDNAVETLNTIEEHDMEDDFMDWFESYFGDEIPTITEVNDILRFDDDWILEELGISDDEDEDEEEDDDSVYTILHRVLKDED